MGKQGDGKKIDGRRVMVDVERGRTVEGWMPRRLGGGRGPGRVGKPSKKNMKKQKAADAEKKAGDKDRDRKDRDRKDDRKDRDRDRKDDRGDRDRGRDRDKEKGEKRD